MTFSFKIIYNIDTDVPGDSGLRSRTVHVDDENEQAAYDYAIEKHWDDRTESIELVA